MATMDATRWTGILSMLLTVMIVGCSSGGGARGGKDGGMGAGTGLASGTACVSVSGAAETCVSSGVTAERTMSSGTIRIDVSHWSNINCCSRSNTEFTFHLTIPDGLPFPYEANQRPG